MPFPFTSARGALRRRRLRRAALTAASAGVIAVAAFCFVLVEPLIPTGTVTCPVASATSTTLRTPCGDFGRSASVTTFIPGHVYMMAVAGIWNRTVFGGRDLTVREGVLWA